MFKRNQSTSTPQKAKEKELFAKWIATPKSMRVVKTQLAFSKEYNITEHMLSVWKKEERFWDMVNEFKIPRYKERVSDVWDKLYKLSMKGNVKAAEMFVTEFDDYKTKKEIAHSGGDIGELLNELAAERKRDTELNNNE